MKWIATPEDLDRILTDLPEEVCFIALARVPIGYGLKIFPGQKTDTGEYMKAAAHGGYEILYIFDRQVPPGEMAERLSDGNGIVGAPGHRRTLVLKPIKESLRTSNFGEA